MEIANWRSHFKSKLASNPEAQTMSLQQCLEAGLINWIEYSLWAKNAYQLALLNDEFASQHQADSKFWTRFKSSYKWSESTLPVAQWEGVIYVACLEKPADLPVSFQPILASPLLLSSFWQAYHQGHSANPSPLATENLQTPEPTPAEAMDGLDMDMLKTLVSKAPDEAFDSILEDVPAEIPGSETLSLDNEELDLSGADLQSPTKSKPEAAPEGFEEVASPTKLFEISKEQKAEPISSEPIIGASASEFPLLAANPNFLKEKRNAITKAKTAINKRYKKSLFLVVDQGQRKAHVISDSFEIANENSIDLTVPNSFNLAVTTQKEFHGPVIKNQTVEKFFEDWNQSEIPENITIVPLVVRGLVLGLFVALGERKTYSNDCLSLVEESVAELLDPSADSKAA